MHNNPFIVTCPKEDKTKKACSCQHDRPVKKEPKKKSLEKLTTVNNVRIGYGR
jgi:hypothetical protein